MCVLFLPFLSTFPFVKSNRIHFLSPPPPNTPSRGGIPTDAEINIPSAENTELSQILFPEPEESSNIVLHISPIARNSAFSISISPDVILLVEWAQRTTKKINQFLPSRFIQLLPPQTNKQTKQPKTPFQEKECFVGWHKVRQKCGGAHLFERYTGKFWPLIHVRSTWPIL